MNNLTPLDLEDSGDFEFNKGEDMFVYGVYQKGVNEARFNGSNVSTSACVGHRPLWQNDPALKQLKETQTWTFRAGYKMTHLDTFIAQSFPSPTNFTVLAVDSATAALTWITNLTQPNATDAF